MDSTPIRFVISDTSRMNMDQLAEAINAVYQGYYLPVEHTPVSFAAFCRQYSLDCAQSVLMVDETGHLTGLAMLALRAGGRGWCGSFGIVSRYRGQNLAGLLAKGLIDRARELGLTTLQLEVLAQNERAIKTYRQAGFEIVRNLVVLNAPIGPVEMAYSTLGIREVELGTALKIAASLESPVANLQPCWQVEPVSLGNLVDGRALVAEQNDLPVGVMIYRASPSTAQISLSQLNFRDPAVVGPLLQYAAALHPAARGFYLLNAPEGSPQVETLLTSHGFKETNRQYEMQMIL